VLGDSYVFSLLLLALLVGSLLFTSPGLGTMYPMY